MSNNIKESGNSNINITNHEREKVDPMQAFAWDIVKSVNDLEKIVAKNEKSLSSFKYVISFLLLFLFIVNLALASFILYNNSKVYAEYDKMRYLNNTLSKTIDRLENSAELRRIPPNLAESRRVPPNLGELENQ